MLNDFHQPTTVLADHFSGRTVPAAEPARELCSGLHKNELNTRKFVTAPLTSASIALTNPGSYLL